MSERVKRSASTVHAGWHVHRRGRCRRIARRSSWFRSILKREAACVGDHRHGLVLFAHREGQEVKRYLHVVGSSLVATIGRRANRARCGGVDHPRRRRGSAGRLGQSKDATGRVQSRRRLERPPTIVSQGACGRLCCCGRSRTGATRPARRDPASTRAAPCACRPCRFLLCSGWSRGDARTSAGNGARAARRSIALGSPTPPTENGARRVPRRSRDDGQ